MILFLFLSILKGVFFNKSLQVTINNIFILLGSQVSEWFFFSFRFYYLGFK